MRASSAFLYLRKTYKYLANYGDGKTVLDESVALASASRPVAVEIYKLEFTERLKDLPDIRLSEVKVQGSNIKAIREFVSRKLPKRILVPHMLPDAVTPGGR